MGSALQGTCKATPYRTSNSDGRVRFGLAVSDERRKKIKMLTPRKRFQLTAYMRNSIFLYQKQISREVLISGKKDFFLELLHKMVTESKQIQTAI